MAKCFKCGDPGYVKWRICADESDRWVCLHHDIELNRIGLRWAYPRAKAERLQVAYVAKVLGVQMEAAE